MVPHRYAVSKKVASSVPVLLGANIFDALGEATVPTAKRPLPVNVIGLGDAAPGDHQRISPEPFTSITLPWFTGRPSEPSKAPRVIPGSVAGGELQQGPKSPVVVVGV